MDERLKKYCEINRFFLENVCSIQDCILEANTVQKTLIELTELKAEFETKFSIASREYELFMAQHRCVVKQILDKNSVKNVTKEVIEDRVIANYDEGYKKVREAFDEAKLNSDLCTDLKYIMLQRKDLICEVMQFMKAKHESESCIFNNQKFMEKVLKTV